MKLAMVGLGRMGGGMVARLLKAGHEVVAYDLSDQAVDAAVAAGASGAHSLEEVIAQLEIPRVAWVMVPAGDPTRLTVGALRDLMSPGDVIVDGGNSNFRLTIESEPACTERGVRFVDVGTSGGVFGMEEGYCLMVGGQADAVAVLEPALAALAPPDGWLHVGPTGAGHFVKMVHNGIEYALLQSYAEGFELLDAAPEFDLDLSAIAHLWRQGSVVRSWLLDLTELALADDGFASVRPYVEDSGEGRWTVEEAVRRAVPLPAITASLFARFASRQDESFGARLIAALRAQFGGHAVARDEQ